MGREIGRLNALRVAAAKLPEGKTKHLVPDGGNLYLEIVQGKEGLLKSWLFNYQLHHRRRFMGLGPAHTVSLAEARTKARAYRQQLIEGIDPLDAKRERIRAIIAEKTKATTFQECAESYMRLHGDGWSTKHLHQWRATLESYVLPKIGKLAPADIDSALVMKVVEPLWKTKTVTASRVLDRIALVLDFAATSGFRSGDNPARLTRAALPKQAKIASVEHLAALPFEMVPAFMARLRTINTPAARATELLILTVSRSDELRLAMWGEIDFAVRKWTRPADHMKGNQSHEVPLCDRAIEILRALGPGEPLRPIFSISKSTIPRLVERLKPEGIQAVPHGFRSSFRQWAATRTGYADHIVETALAHKISNAVVKAYKRRAEPYELRARLMQQWADFCAKPEPAGDNVVAMRKADV
jgi:integrase